MNLEDAAVTINDRRLYRESQTTTERLIEMLTGMTANSPFFLERLADDKRVIRNKYDLPPLEMRDQDPSEYYHRLMQLAVKNGLKVKPKEWDAEFFEENPDSEAKFEPDTMTIVFDLDITNHKKLKKSLRDFEHELIHGLQVTKSQNMPIEVMEYETNVANAPIELMKKSSASLRLSIFGQSLVGSVLNWYQRQGQTPEWDNSEWFLKNVDKVS